MTLSMRETMGMRDTYTLSGKTYTFHAQDVYVLSAKRIRFTRGGYTSYSKSLVDGVLLHEKAPTYSTCVGAINSGGNALAVVGVEKVASSLGLESLEACLP